MSVTIHKSRRRSSSPRVSVILLDWSCREHFQALRWLNDQDCDRDSYELIWVELYDRVVPEALEHADLVITCSQKGMYHKHEGYNAGVLNATGSILTICDSDAVFPRNFISSVTESFAAHRAHVLMHYENRTTAFHPARLDSLAALERFPWQPLWPNVGACMSLYHDDAIRLGGFDEDASFRGYLCGPYDLGWRLINLGLPEIWCEPAKCALWHFAHPEPTGKIHGFDWNAWREITHPHIEYHALTAVEAFSAGRVLPLVENKIIHRLRMERRRIGTEYEERYARYPAVGGFSRGFLFQRRIALAGEMLRRVASSAWRDFLNCPWMRRVETGLARFDGAKDRIWESESESPEAIRKILFIQMAAPSRVRSAAARVRRRYPLARIVLLVPSGIQEEASFIPDEKVSSLEPGNYSLADRFRIVRSADGFDLAVLPINNRFGLDYLRLFWFAFRYAPRLLIGTPAAGRCRLIPGRTFFLVRPLYAVWWGMWRLFR